MKKYLILMILACTAAACGHTLQSSRQQQQTAQGEAPKPEQSLCGGYTEQRALTDDERQLFEEVTRGLDGIDYTPESVATQVVAGINYRFICTAKTLTPKPETYQTEITVYKPLPGQGDPKITQIRRL